MEDAEIDSRLLEILEWRTPIPAMRNVRIAVQGKSFSREIGINSAICFDSNVLINLGKGSRGAEIIDYLRAVHVGPVILPSQVLVEFWNHQLSGIDSFFAQFQRQAEDLNKTVAEIDPRYSDLQDAAKKVVDKFDSDYGFILNPRTRTEVVTLVEMLEERAEISQVGRVALTEVADARDRTKIPPGFRDSGNGDFFVWAEFLRGLLAAVKDGKNFDAAVLVTDDVKKDWSTKGIPHPILAAEVEAAGGVPLYVMKLDAFRTAVKKAVSPSPPRPSDEQDTHPSIPGASGIGTESPADSG